MDSIRRTPDPVTRTISRSLPHAIRIHHRVGRLGSSTSRPDPRRCPFTSRLPPIGATRSPAWWLRLDRDAHRQEFVLTDLAATTRSGRTTPTLLGRRVRRTSPAPAARWLGTAGESAVIRWTLDAGFEPARRIDQLSRANPPVAGLGFIAIRDTATWLKNSRRARSRAASLRYGSSQSGRFLRSLMYEASNDEHNRQCSTG